MSKRSKQSSEKAAGNIDVIAKDEEETEATQTMRETSRAAESGPEMSDESESAPKETEMEESRSESRAATEITSSESASEETEPAEIETAKDAIFEEETAAARIAEDNTSDNNKKKSKKQKKPKKDIFDIKKDIRYRGPISYRHLKIFGWICLIIYQVSVVIGIGNSMGMGLDVGVLSDSTFAGNIHDMALPLIIVSIFAVLLSKRDSYKETIILYGVLAVGLAGLFLLFYYHYILGIFQPISSLPRPLSIEMPGKEIAEEFLTSMLFNMDGFKGFFAFNIFIDMFLCTLVMFFMEYTPKRFFQGKKIIFFRAMVLLPVFYEVASIFIKILTTNKLIEIPLWISPFLTTKPPMSMIMFFSVVRYIIKEKNKFLATGRTEEEYEEYRKTNIHSFRFSKHLSLIILVYAALDLALLFILTSVHIVLVDNITDMTYLTSQEGMAQVLSAAYKVWNWGIGNTMEMIELIPVVLLFSYTRTHKVKVIDRLIPIIGIILIVLVYFEGAFQLIQNWLDYGLYEIRYKIQNNENITGLYFQIEQLFNQYGGPFTT